MMTIFQAQKSVKPHLPWVTAGSMALAAQKEAQ